MKSLIIQQTKKHTKTQLFAKSISNPNSYNYAYGLGVLSALALESAFWQRLRAIKVLLEVE